MMRSAVLIAGCILAVATPSFAEWIEYKNPMEAFAINFPIEPKVTNITYTTESGAAVPAKVFSADEGAGHYTVTAVDLSTSPKDEAQAMAHAAAQMRLKGQVKFDYDSELDGIHGHQLSMILPTGAQYQVQLFLYLQEHRLYIAEGTVPAGVRPPALFWTSLAMIHPDGSVVNLVREGKATRRELPPSP
jgi:hypothetical protein